MNYRALCDLAGQQGAEGCGQLSQDILRLLSAEIDLLTFAYPCHGPDSLDWYILIGLPILAADGRGAALIHVDISSLVRGDFIRAISVGPVTQRDGVTEISRSWLIAEIEKTLQHSFPAQITMPRSTGEPQRTAVRGADSTETKALLTPRQSEVLALIKEGKTNAEIAAALSASPNTIKLHVAAILKRMGVTSRTKAAAIAARLDER